jgi:hypothetical protein
VEKQLKEDDSFNESRKTISSLHKDLQGKPFT